VLTLVAQQVARGSLPENFGLVFVASVAEPFDHRGVQFREGELVVVNTHAANHDARRFAEPTNSTLMQMQARISPSVSDHTSVSAPHWLAFNSRRH
jgi:cytochrome P450